MFTNFWCYLGRKAELKNSQLLGNKKVKFYDKDNVQNQSEILAKENFKEVQGLSLHIEYGRDDNEKKLL